MSCIAVDDEPLALKLLLDNISKVPFLNLIATCDDAFEALGVLQKNEIDLVFIDIQMPGLTGLELVGSLEKKPMIIFITAYKQYALESYDLAVVDYLVKPVAIDRFIKACFKAKEIHELKLSKILSPIPPSSEYFFLNIDYRQVKVAFDDIIWIGSLRDYVRINLKSSTTPLIVRASLKALELELPRGKFIRFHKSYLVATSQITAVLRNSVYINEKEFPVGETYREVIEKLIRREL